VRPPDPQLGKPVADTTGSKAPNPFPSATEARTIVYRQDCRDASTLAEQVLERLCRDVRQKPCRLPLAAHRIGGLVNSGRLPYRASWDALCIAAMTAGAGEPWVLRCMYKGFAESNISDLPSPALWRLVNEGVQ